MTSVIYESFKNETSLCIMGHCNAGRINGMDLCCCAVSMLIFTMLDSLKRLKLRKYRYSYGGGWCHVTFQNRGGNFKKAQTIIETIMNGFELLEKKYPQKVKVIASPENRRM